MPIPSFITIDEVGLLPGATEPRDISGTLDLDYTKSIAIIQFSPLISQTLAEMNLSSHGTPLFYTLENNQTEFVGRAGANGEDVFKASVSNDGTFQFTLFQTLDRAHPENIVSDEVKRFKLNHDYGDHHEVGLGMNIPTEAQHPYQLSFYYAPPEEAQANIDIFWGGKHLYSLTPAIAGWTGFIFSVLGNTDIHTELKFVTKDNIALDNIVHNLTLLDAAQSQLPLPFAYDCDGHMGTFTVNVTTDVPIVTTNDPFNIVYEQSVYQNIIVQSTHGENDPITKINLDALFESMHISREHRQVEVTHQEATNMYAVHIYDSSDPIFSPITVADVRLSLDGGDGGLDVFYKHIQFL